MPRKSIYSGSLPDCEGPKLGPFQDRNAPIIFHRLLSDADPDAVGHAHVFEVSIRSAVYALKIFKFFDDAGVQDSLSTRDKTMVTADVARKHMDPFYNECRAYGKLIETRKNGIIAVRCHGYLTLPAAMEDDLEDRFHVATWDRPDHDYEKPLSKRQPLRAILKDLVVGDEEFTAKDVKKMLRHLRQFQKLGIYNLDLMARNYRGGLLIDFSVAMTHPHFFFQTRPQWQFDMYQRQDRLSFDFMIKDADLGVWDRATPNREYKKKLRPSTRLQSSTAHSKRQRTG